MVVPVACCLPDQGTISQRCGGWSAGLKLSATMREGAMEHLQDVKPVAELPRPRFEFSAFRMEH